MKKKILVAIATVICFVVVLFACLVYALIEIAHWAFAMKRLQRREEKSNESGKSR